MLIHLSDVLSMEGKALEVSLAYGKDSFQSSMGTFPIVEKNPVRLKVVNTGDGKAHLTGGTRFSVEASCDRCLNPVVVSLELKFDMDLFSPDKMPEDEDARPFMEGLELDVDELVQEEVLLNWPLKILCKEDCRGICPVCGQNLNIRYCGCDTFVPDPRMAVLKDIFESNKEVE